MGDEKAEIEARAAEEQAIQTFKIKKLIASLERARGCVPMLPEWAHVLLIDRPCVSQERHEYDQSSASAWRADQQDIKDVDRRVRNCE